MGFKKGKSGNPAGRPVGIIDRRSLLRAQLDGRAEELVEAAISRALDGDSGLIRALLSRLLPPAKPETQPFEVDYCESPLEQAMTVIRAIAAGQIAPSVGSEFICALTNTMAIRDSESLSVRIKALEELCK